METRLATSNLNTLMSAALTTAISLRKATVVFRTLRKVMLAKGEAEITELTENYYRSIFCSSRH